MTFVLLAVGWGLHDPIIAQTPARAYQLFARQTRLSELCCDFGKTGTGQIYGMLRRSSDPVTDIGLQLADEQLQLALFEMRYTEHHPHMAMQRGRVRRLTLALSNLADRGLLPNRDHVHRELQTMSARTSAELDKELTIYTDGHPRVAMLRQRLQAITQLVNQYKQNRDTVPSSRK